MSEHTPMMRQYLEIKAQYEDAFLFFRLGDFYELFYEDAVLAAQELEITLTGRGQGEERIPMCGVPHHSADQYMARLINKGYKIAICEQMEDPKEAKGVVKREVVRVLTPGTIMDYATIAEKENNYIISLTTFANGMYGLARADLTTGECAVTKTNYIEDVLQDINSSNAKELVISEALDEKIVEKINKQHRMTISYENEETIPSAYASLVKKLYSDKLIVTFARLLNYLIRTQKRLLGHLQEVIYYSIESFMKMDIHTKRNLELTESLRDKKKAGSLLAVIDETVTAMGGRLLKNWLERPLRDKSLIEKRLQIVTSFKDAFFEREQLRDDLRQVYDIERLAGRIAYGNVNARELVQLRESLKKIPSIKRTIETVIPSTSETWFQHEATITELVQLLCESIVDDPPMSITEGGMIKDGFNEKLDTYRKASTGGKEWLASFEQKEREATGIKSLKIGYNRVFGYFIEVTKANLHLLPEDRYERKQTLTNVERFSTPELKEQEALIIEAEDKMEQLEYDLFLSIRDEAKKYMTAIQQLAQQISEIDVLASFATVSEKNDYVRPTFSPDQTIEIKEGRHPVVEDVMKKGHYVPNDVYMHAGREMLLITGPNMSGKSTYMRQLALIAIMAQIGCYVPATYAKLPIFDQVFTRIGAADDLASGQSTFMVEMLETHHALTKATEHSLLLLDEIGRGTSTYDGMALAQAIIEYIHNNIRAKTLFSTHYHELTELADQLTHLQNVHVSSVWENNTVVFLHKVVDGQADRSYGIHVAQLAGLPMEVIERAEKLLVQFEENDITIERKNENNVQKEAKKQEEQLSLFPTDTLQSTEIDKTNKDEVIKKLMHKDVLHMTPLEALQFINELQQTLK